MSLERPLESLSDDALLAGLADVLCQYRRVESSFIAHIAEVDARRLFARYACPSMFVYCLNVLHLSEGETNLRIAVARAAREHPVLLEMLADGRLHLSGIARLAPVLTPGNRDVLLRRAVHKSKRQIEEIVAEVDPRPDAPSVIRKLPERPTAPPQPAEGVELVPDSPLRFVPDADPCPSRAPLPVFEPLSPARYKVQFTAGLSFATTWRGSGRSCARRCRTATSPRSSERRSESCGSGWRRGDSLRRSLPGGAGVGRPPHHDILRPRCDALSINATAGAAASWTRKEEDAPRGTASNITTSIRTDAGVATSSTTSA